MPNPYVILAIVVAVLGAIWKTYDMGYTAGANDVTAAFAAANAAAAEEGKQDVKEIIKWKEKRVIVYRDRIKEIKIADDPSGCLDQPLSAVGLGGLLPGAGGDTPGREPDGAAGNIPGD